MPFIPVQLSTITPAGAFETYPQGLYDLVIKDSKQETSKEGNPKLSIQYAVESGPNGSTKFHGKTLPRSYSLLPQALGFLKRLVLAAGISDQDIANAGGMLSDEMLIGRRIRARVTVREYQGRETNEVQELYGDTLQAAMNEMSGQAPAAAANAALPAPQGYATLPQVAPPAPQGYATMPQAQMQPQMQVMQQPAYAPPPQFSPPAPVPGAYSPSPAPVSAWGAAAPQPGFGNNGAMAPQAPPQPPTR